MAVNLHGALSEHDFADIIKEYDEIGEKIADWLQRAKYLKNCDRQAHLDCLTHAKICQDRKNELAPYVIAWQRKKAEIAAVPNYVKNVCRCGICGAAADRDYDTLICQSNHGHRGDTWTGIFSDLSWRGDAKQVTDAN